MAEHKVATEEALRAASGRCLVKIAEREIGLFRVGDRVVAYGARCPHQGGPVCLGKVMHAVEGVLDEGGAVLEERYDRSRLNLVCPWHGFEFDLQTGRSTADPTFRLLSYDVTIRDGDIYLTV